MLPHYCHRVLSSQLFLSPNVATFVTLAPVIVWYPLLSPANVAIAQSGPTFVVNIAELNQQTSQVWRHCVAHNIVIVA